MHSARLSSEAVMLDSELRPHRLPASRRAAGR